MSKATLVLVLGAFLVSAAGLVIAGCGPNWGNDDDDDNFTGASIDVDCSCAGLTEAIYEDCNGEVFTQETTLTDVEFSQSCLVAISEGGPEADTYKCYIGAACSAHNCEDAAKFLNLCNI